MHIKYFAFLAIVFAFTLLPIKANAIDVANADDVTHVVTIVSNNSISSVIVPAGALIRNVCEICVLHIFPESDDEDDVEVGEKQLVLINNGEFILFRNYDSNQHDISETRFHRFPRLSKVIGGG